MAKVSIILLNYNSTKLSKKCVQSIWETDDKKHDLSVIIYDNGSKSPPTEDEFKRIDLVLSDTNDGFTGGYNKAITYAIKHHQPDYLLILNNDTRVTKGMISQLVSTFESDSNIGFVVPKIYFEKGYEFFEQAYNERERGKVIWYAGGGIDWPNMIVFHKGVDEVDRGQFEGTTSVDFLSLYPKVLARREKIKSVEDYPKLIKRFKEKRFVINSVFASGCCILTTPTIWKKLKGFDHKYFLYYEDADLSMRLQKKLKKHIVFEPRATLYHLNAGSTGGSGSVTHQYYQTRSRLRFGLNYSTVRVKLALLKEAKKLFFQGTDGQRLGILHALEGKWGNQQRILHRKRP